MYKEDDTTGTEITNLFGFAEGDTTYLSRTDWEGTFPQKQESYTASEALLIGKAEYEKGETEYASLYGAEPTYNATNGINLADLKGLAYEDALWEKFLDQFTVKEGGAYGAMSSFSFLGSKWCGGSSELLQDLLREEWGFRGVVSTDACLGDWMDAGLAVKNGNDLMLEMGLLASEQTLKDAYKKDPIGIGYGLRNSIHNICYALVNGTNMY